MGRLSGADPYVRIAESLACELGDDLLRGAAGLARGWWQLGRDDVDAAIATLRPLRTLGGDVHQHHFIDGYIALALFRRKDDASAAAQWLACLRTAIAVGHSRGISAAIEGCGYLAERRGLAAEACRFLGASEQIRRRTGIPLFSFWQRHHDVVKLSLRATLGETVFSENFTLGMRTKEEDAANNADAALLAFAAGVVAS